MVNLLTTGRKDDLESLIYILCFLIKGTLPIVNLINSNIQNVDVEMSNFFDRVLKFRKDLREECHDAIKLMLPGSMRSAFCYITSLSHQDKPDYDLIKLYLSFDHEDEERLRSSKLIIQNERLARDVLYQAANNNNLNNSTGEEN